MTGKPTPRVSVIIPVFRDAAGAARVAAALRQQEDAPTPYEIVLVDNAEKADPALRDIAGVRLVHEPRGYSYSARNAGVAASQGDILAFTDADCEPASDWLRRGHAALADRNADLVGGQVAVYCERPSWAARYDQAFGLQQEQFFAKFGALATANVFMRRRVFDVLGGFDASLQSGGDFDFCRRAGSAGFGIAFAPEVIVAHPARDTLAQLRAKVRRVAGGIADSRYAGLQTVARQPQYWRGFVRPQLRDWWATLVGGNGSEQHGWLLRPGLLMLRIYFQYRLALDIAHAVRHRDRRKTSD